ncbi:DUF1254 domain-containing protein [Tsukamurella sp. 8F]|uniref:DUF1254 domain-containing protein n=1 Tax=unclassified Tsukamurella TaxID=2633480 RepID=UPI0023B89E79|nr:MULTISPECIES: DUF1254 domain-containing protein [unclassified Tsukamurella]MDF0530410.1 DUF1254 domain-containing protein [Tsukamurella sp. 8J]MDF0587769.1 DUF1254 domain-containing protein [Tsukamurella sp. 8F]
MTVPVHLDNFVRAESDRYFANKLVGAGINSWVHRRGLAALDDQRVIRTNRDTLYSSAIIDVSDGATLTLPGSGGRYLSVAVISQDHYIVGLYHDGGEYTITEDQVGSRFAAVLARIFVDPGDPDDVAAANALQDRLRIRADSARPFTSPDYEQQSLDAVRNALLELARYGRGGSRGAFGSHDAVDPVRHLLGAAVGWGGLPEQEAFYEAVYPNLPIGRYTLSVRDVPVDAFWSVSVYQPDGYFDPDSDGPVTVNSVTAVPDSDGTVTVVFGGPPDQPNRLALTEGWNYLIRYYRPRAEILDGTWSFPAVDTDTRAQPPAT